MVCVTSAENLKTQTGVFETAYFHIMARYLQQEGKNAISGVFCIRREKNLITGKHASGK